MNQSNSNVKPIESHDLLGIAEALNKISLHADKLIGRGEFRRFSLEEIPLKDRKSYKKRRLLGIPSCSHVLIYEPGLTGWSLYYAIGSTTYLRVFNA